MIPAGTGPRKIGLFTGSLGSVFRQQFVGNTLRVGSIPSHEGLGATDRIINALQYKPALVLADDEKPTALDVELLAQACRQNHPAIRRNLNPVVLHGRSPSYDTYLE